MADSASAADPYAAQKGNIRDTVKYMAAAYAACATVMFAGVSFSGLGSLSPAQLAPALVAGFIALACVFGGISAIMGMLIGDFCFPSRLGQDAKNFIDEHHVDVLPAGITSYDAFLTAFRSATAEVETQRTAWRELPPLPAAGEVGREAAEAQEKLVKDAYDQAIATVNTYRSLLSQTVGLAHLHLLQERLKALQPKLLTLTVIGSAAFAVAVFFVTRKPPQDCFNIIGSLSDTRLTALLAERGF